MANVYMDRISNHSEADSDDERTCCSRQCVVKHVKKNLLVLFLIVGITAGVLLGVGLRVYHKDFSEDERNQMYIGFPGTRGLPVF